MDPPNRPPPPTAEQVMIASLQRQIASLEGVIRGGAAAQPSSKGAGSRGPLPRVVLAGAPPWCG